MYTFMFQTTLSIKSLQYLLWVVNINKLTNRFQVAVHLFSNRSQMTSKCGKTQKGDTQGAAECVTDVLNFIVCCGQSDCSWQQQTAILIDFFKMWP